MPRPGRPTRWSTRRPGRRTPRRPKSGAEDVDRAYRAAAEGVRGVGRHDTVRAAARAAARSPTRSRSGRRSSSTRSRKDTGKPLGFTMSEELPPAHRPDPFLRRRRAGARGQVGGGVPQGPHLVHPARADRRGRPGDALELPADDDGLEDRAGSRRRQLHRAQAAATPRRRPRRCWPSWPQEFLPPGRAQRGDRRPRHRPAVVEHPIPQLVAITGSVRAGMQVAALGCRPAQAGPPRARRQGAGDRLRRRRHRGGRRGHRRGRLLQRRSGLHRGHPGARRARRPRRLRGRADRAGQEHQDRAARRRGHPLRAAQQRRTSSSG